MIHGVIFDMDGLIIDSEPFWQRAEIAVFNTVGINLTPETCALTKGLRIDEVVEYWYHRKPWTNKTLKAVENEIVDYVEHLMTTEGKAKDGLYDIIRFFQHKQLKLSVASSSYYRLIKAALIKLNIFDTFEIIHSAEYEDYGKPHPAVFITTANKLQLRPENCLVLEDSLRGVIAGKAAEMKVIAVPEMDDERFIIADAKIFSLVDFDERLFDKLNESI